MFENKNNKQKIVISQTVQDKVINFKVRKQKTQFIRTQNNHNLNCFLYPQTKII